MAPWEWIAGALGGFLAGAAGAAAALWWAKKNRWPWPELEQLQDDNTKLGHRVKMLQGRLNQVAPPREGTGADSVPPELSQGRPRSRVELLRKLKGG